MKEFLDRQTMAMITARELKDSDVVNLGGGLPVLVRDYLPPGIEVIWHSENGVINYGRYLSADDADKLDFDYISAGGQFFLPEPGTVFVDHAVSFIVATSGRLDVSVLGGIEVSEEGDLANWTTDMDCKIGGIGGSFDLIAGAKRIIIMMTHVTKDGKSKIVKKCHFPLSGKKCVNTLITDVGIFDFTPQGIQVRGLAPGWTLKDVQSITEPSLTASPAIKEIELSV